MWLSWRKDCRITFCGSWTIRWCSSTFWWRDYRLLCLPVSVCVSLSASLLISQSLSLCLSRYLSLPLCLSPYLCLSVCLSLSLFLSLSLSLFLSLSLSLFLSLPVCFFFLSLHNQRKHGACSLNQAELELRDLHKSSSD